MLTNVDLVQKKLNNVTKCVPKPNVTPMTFNQLDLFIAQASRALVDAVEDFQVQSAPIKEIDQTLVANRNDLNVMSAYIQEIHRQLQIMEIQLFLNDIELNAINTKTNWLEQYTPAVDIFKLKSKNKRKLSFLKKLNKTEKAMMHLKKQDEELAELMECSMQGPEKNLNIWHVIDSHCKVLENVYKKLIQLENTSKAAQILFEQFPWKM